MQELAHILAAFAPKHYVHMVWHSAISQHPHGSELAWRYPTHRRVCPQLNRRALPTDRLPRMCKRMRTRPHKCCASVTFFFIRQAARRDLRSRLRLRATEATKEFQVNVSVDVPSVASLSGWMNAQIRPALPPDTRQHFR